MIKKAVLEGAKSTKQLDMSTFDLTIARNIILATLVAFGSFFGLRGTTEHSKLLLSNIVKGFFGSNHDLADKECYMLRNMNTKTSKLSMAQPALKNEKDVRIPVNSPAGKAITALLNGMGPAQTRFYFYPATPKHKKMLARCGLGEVMFNASKPIGVNTICSMFKEAAVRLRFKNTDTSGHAF